MPAPHPFETLRAGRLSALLDTRIDHPNIKGSEAILERKELAANSAAPAPPSGTSGTRSRNVLPPIDGERRIAKLWTLGVI